jgi:hypothetical protein
MTIDMPPRFHPFARALRVSSILLLISLGSGCATHKPNAPIAVVYPTTDTPVHVLEALQWAYRHRDLEFYETLFTEDFVFVFAEQDSAGNAFRDRPWTREDEIAYARNLFVGGSSSEPPADKISLDFTNTLIALPDHRPGKDPMWHQEIMAESHLLVDRGGSAFEVRGPGLFYFVRGDSAAIPADLVARGYGPDPNRWWIERWEDQTGSGVAVGFNRRPVPLEANPSHVTTWGSVKALYR